MNNFTAKIAHEVNRAYCSATGDDSHKPWKDSPLWQKQSAVTGVDFHTTSERTPEESHESWLATKESEGWVYGDVKDEVKKTHPCMLPYSELPVEQRVKDHLFKAVVDACKSDQNKVEFEHIQNMVDSLEFKYVRAHDTTVTRCWAFLPNGFQVGYGESACVDPANFGEAEGQKWARERSIDEARNKLWELEGYLLKVTGRTSNNF